MCDQKSVSGDLYIKQENYEFDKEHRNWQRSVL